MTLKVYAYRLSQPSRAIIIFCKVNGIDFEEISIDLLKGEHKTPEYKEINPMAQVPAIVDDGLKISESHAILRYIAEKNPEIPDHWYPADFISRAKVNSILDWHHSNLRVSSVTFIMNTVLAPKFGRTMNPQAAAEAEKLLSSSLSIIESLWLNGDAEFLLGNPKPSIADLSLVCEITQSEMDVKPIFLHECLEELYIMQPECYKIPDKEVLVCRLTKSLYGLKQTPRQRHNRFDKFMSENGYLK